MNRTVSRIGAAIVTVSVFLFALFLIIDFSFGYYFVCMFLPVGYIMTAAGFQHESRGERRVPANVGLVLSAVYAVLILLVYFAQTTTVRLEQLSGQAETLLDFSRGGLIFNYDLLGYGMMALSTFFIGLSVDAENREDKWLKSLMMIHGVFFPGCFIMPMTGVFSGMSDGGTSTGGTSTGGTSTGGTSTGGTSTGGVIALVAWCVYFLPVGILSYRHFGRGTGSDGIDR